MVEHLPIRTRALLLGAGLLFAAGAMLGLVLPIRAELEGFPTALIGLIGSAFAAGYVAGCLYVPRLVAKVGHIRVFGVMAALVAMTALINVLYVSPLAWILVRAMTGFAFAGATMIIESWLSESASSETRGRVFARYMVVNLASSVLGQLAVMLYQPGGFEPFVIVAILACLALIPTALSSSRAPAPLHEVKLDFKRLIRVSPIAVVACFGVGLANGAFGTLAPVYANSIGLPVWAVALLVAGAIVGGALMQVPIGRLSDRLDRRWVVVGIALAGAGMSFLLYSLELREPAHVILMVALLGGAMHTIYPVAVAHANDRAAEGNFVAVSSGLLLIFGAGATLGPAVAAPLMQWGEPGWLFLFLVFIYSGMAVHAVWRTRVQPPVEEVRHTFVGLEAIQGATQETMHLDPRAEEPGEEATRSS
ncbi:MFS transporter [Ectothiorhodospira shaposhnikovii]|uniref:MFS transporter n=1 Tax=Ectothiorhodospira shaposhnikovii TaxID=1054 RepID=UPI001EE848B6|nr:MFS transporter [Ectothiorhodospira shaposhnikovii]MCG5511800.1 MFS transporter [Ectothiorhodospira shaposhnikovii]